MMLLNRIAYIACLLHDFIDTIDTTQEKLNNELPCMLYKGVDSKGKGEYFPQEIQITFRDVDGKIIEGSDDYIDYLPEDSSGYLINLVDKAKESNAHSIQFWTIFDWEYTDENGVNHGTLSDEEIELEFDLNGNITRKEGF